VILVRFRLSRRVCHCSDPWRRHRDGFHWEGPPYNGLEGHRADVIVKEE